MAEHSLKLIIEAIDRTDAGLGKVQGNLRNVENAAKATNAAIASGLNGLQSGFNQMGAAANAGLRSITSGLDPLRGTLDSINAGVGSLQANVSRISGLFGGLIAAIPIIAGIGAATNFMTKSLEDAGKETQNFIALQAVWRAQSRGTEGDLSALTEQVKTLSRTSSYASQDVIGAMKFLAGFPAVATKDLMPALKVAIDFAAYSGTGIQQATQVLGFAATGRTAWLEHFYGFHFTEATKQSKDFSKILAEMGERVSGQEAAKMETYAGAVGALEKAFNRVEKAVGHVLEAAIVPVLKDLVGYFSEFGKSVEEAFAAGATQEWEARFREMFESIAAYTKRTFDGIRNFATEGGFERIFTALSNIISAMQTMIGWAGRLLNWFVMLPKEVLVFIAAGLGITAVIKIVRLLWTQWVALGNVLVNAKIQIQGYAAQAVSALTSEKLAVDAVTTAYARKGSAALTAAYAAQAGNLGKNAAERQSVINTIGVEYAGRYTAGMKPHTPETVAPTGGLAAFGKGRAAASVASGLLMGGATYAATGDVGTSVLAGLAGSLDLVLNAVSRLRPLISGIGNAFSVFWTTLRSGAGIMTAVRTGISVLGTVVAGITAPLWAVGAAVAALVGGGFYLWATRWSEAAKIRKEGIEQEEKSLKRLQKEGYGLTTKLRDLPSKEELQKKGSGELLKILKDEQKELAAQAARLGKLVKEKGEWDAATGKQTNKEVQAQETLISKIRERMQWLRELTIQKKEMEKAPETVNLLEDVKAIREKHKLIMELAKGEYDEKRLLLQMELVERKAIIAQTISSAVRAQMEIFKAEQETSAKRIGLLRQNYENTKRLQAAAYGEERGKAAEGLNSSNVDERKKAFKELAQIDRAYAAQQVETARQTTEALQKELQQQYQIRSDLFKKINALEQQAQDAERATAQAVRSIAEAAGSEYVRLYAKLEDAQDKLAKAVELMPKFPEKALQLAKEAQGAFAGLAQNIDSLEQNLKTSQEMIADTLRDIDQSRLTGAEKWHAEMKNVQTDLERAQKLESEGRTKEAESAYKGVLGKAKQLATSGPEGMKTQAREQAGEIAAQAGASLLTMQREKTEEMKAFNAQVKEGTEGSGDVIKTEIGRQIDEIRDNVEALDENTKALKDLIKTMSGDITQARQGTQEQVERMNKPQRVPGQGETPPPEGARPYTEAEAMAAAEAAPGETWKTLSERTEEETKKRAEAETEKRRRDKERLTNAPGADLWAESAPAKAPASETGPEATAGAPIQDIPEAMGGGLSLAEVGEMTSGAGGFGTDTGKRRGFLDEAFRDAKAEMRNIEESDRLGKQLKAAGFVEGGRTKAEGGGRDSLYGAIDRALQPKGGSSASNEETAPAGEVARNQVEASEIMRDAAEGIRAAIEYLFQNANKLTEFTVNLEAVDRLA